MVTRSNGEILETPRRTQDYLLEFEYDQALFATPQSPCRTPPKRAGPDGSTPNDSMEVYNHIEDLNKVGAQRNSHRKLNLSKTIDPTNLQRLQSLNDKLLFKNDESKTENSFFTPHLYNGKFASTPIAKVETRRGDSTVPVDLQAASTKPTTKTPQASVRRSMSRLSCSFLKSSTTPLDNKSSNVTVTDVFATVIAWMRKLHTRNVNRITGKLAQVRSWFGVRLHRVSYRFQMIS